MSEASEERREDAPDSPAEQQERSQDTRIVSKDSADVPGGKRKRKRLIAGAAVACVLVCAIVAGIAAGTPGQDALLSTTQEAQTQQPSSEDDAAPVADEAQNTQEEGGQQAAQGAASGQDAKESQSAESGVSSGDTSSSSGKSSSSSSSSAGSSSGSGSKGTGQTGSTSETITCSVYIDSSRATGSWPSSLGSGTVTLSKGATVLDALKKLGVSVRGTSYVSSIGGLKEFDCGQGSGWLYSVNGDFPGKPCNEYVLSGGESIRWVYTIDYGNDV